MGNAEQRHPDTQCTTSGHSTQPVVPDLSCWMGLDRSDNPPTPGWNRLQSQCTHQCGPPRDTQSRGWIVKIDTPRSEVSPIGRREWSRSRRNRWRCECTHLGLQSMKIWGFRIPVGNWLLPRGHFPKSEEQIRPVGHWGQKSAEFEGKCSSGHKQVKQLPAVWGHRPADPHLPAGSWGLGMDNAVDHIWNCPREFPREKRTWPPFASARGRKRSLAFQGLHPLVT